jgi:hypothetical protein
MNDAALKAALEREEQAYEDLLGVRASLGTMLWETIRRGRELSEFVEHTRDLSLLTRSADIRRTELKVELLARELKKAKEEERRAIEAARRAAAALEEAKHSYGRAAKGERRWSLETQRLEELHREEMAHLERLRSDEAEQEGEEVGFSGDSRTLEFELPQEQERSQESPEAPQTATTELERVEPRSWWRRVFGG